MAGGIRAHRITESGGAVPHAPALFVTSARVSGGRRGGLFVSAMRLTLKLTAFIINSSEESDNQKVAAMRHSTGRLEMTRFRIQVGAMSAGNERTFLIRMARAKKQNVLQGNVAQACRIRSRSKKNLPSIT